MMFNDKVYQTLKFLAQIGLPAVGALYFGLAQIWGLPKAEEVVGTITVLDTFLGVVLGLTTAAYNRSTAKYDGEVVLSLEDDGRRVFTFDLNEGPQSLESKSEVAFKVVKN